jgi:CCR4-NOT transcription complex subunit 4
VDFPALTASETTPVKEETTTPLAEVSLDAKAREKAERKAAKKAAAAEKAAERTRIAQEKAAQKAAEKAKLVAEKAEKEKAAAELKAQQEKERLEKERQQKEKEKAAKAERERLAQVEREKTEKERLEREKVEKAKAAEKAAKKAAAVKAAEVQKNNKPVTAPAAAPVTTPSSDVEPPIQFLSKKPRKNKPVAKPVKVAHHKEEDHLPDEASSIPSASASVSDAHLPLKGQSTESSTRNNSRATSVERLSGPFTIGDFLHEIHIANPSMDIPNHSFFDLHKINPAAKMPLEYGPLVHALSALSVGGGSFANNVPSGSIDNAVSSFQQLLETLTQTISDLLRLLPRTTWDDSSSFDGVLRDMLKGDDFLDDNADEGAGKEDEVAALTLALERRARWMEVQLSKLEELHRDINTAAVKAVLSFNDNGWDRSGSLPRVGNTLKRFETLGSVSEDGMMRNMNSDELEKKFAIAEEVTVFAETELREMMEKMQVFKPVEEEV